MFGWILDRMHMPTSSVVKVNTPNALLLANERKSNGTSHLVEVHPQKLVWRSMHIDTTTDDWPLGLQGHIPELSGRSQRVQELYHESFYIHRFCNAS